MTAYTPDKDDYQQLIRVLVVRNSRTKKNLIMFLMGIVLVVLSFWYVLRPGNEIRTAARIFFPSAAIFLALVSTFRYCCINAQVRLMMRNIEKQNVLQPEYWQEHQLTVSGDELQLTYGETRQSVPLSSAVMEEEGKIWLIWSDDRIFDLIPKEDQTAELISELQSRITVKHKTDHV